jgi:zinc protease
MRLIPYPANPPKLQELSTERKVPFFQAALQQPMMAMAQDPIGQPTPISLNNGAQGCFQQVSNQSESQINIVLPMDPNNSEAFALIEDMLIRGSQSTKQFTDQSVNNGIKISARRYLDKIVLSLTGPAGEEEKLAQTGLQLLCKPTWDIPSFNKRKQLEMEHCQQALGNPHAKQMQALMKSLYGANHPYGKTIEESMASLSQLTPEAVASFYQQAVANTKGITISMVSGLTIQNQAQLINQQIQQANWYTSPYFPVGNIPEAPPLPVKTGKLQPILIPNESAPRTSFVLGWRAPTMEDKDYWAFELIVSYLYSALFNALRSEKELVYSISQGMHCNQKGSSFTIGTDVNFDKLPEALSEVNQVITDLIQNGIPEAKLNTLKAKFKLQMAEEKETASNIGELTLRQIVSGSPIQHPNETERAIQQLTVSDIQRVANRFLSPKNGLQGMVLSAPQTVLEQYKNLT